MKLLWAALARADLLAIRHFIAEHHPGAAKAVADKILRSANLLREQPELGLATHRNDVRRLLVAGSVYSIIYRISDQDIEIIEVFDGRRHAPRTDLKPGD
ncbi:type II toxin-antitoxin system RelE/ParE family toxin [Rhizobium sp. BE258]|uniref:type II toxin-antitoxin system RelE/ParE family toxin n=1 Tax=Rhizobium sp. BE258 TaxID=2817722 RepID=UPI00285A6D61|nr:type II toxin-antitoxin system RelE/ParE family toxin [Rhizobium sp. BE258]MDR7146209.1 toxin ParE1/3/4 [Rhizobium sp. BE258]